MWQAFIVVFREGFESFLIVGIILAYLRRIGQQLLQGHDRYREEWFEVGGFGPEPSNL